MDVNQVRFGNFSIGNKQAQAKKQEKELQSKQEEQFSPLPLDKEKAEATMNALNIAGMQNMAQVNVVGKKDVNPADHLSSDRMADIEAMMADFEVGVNQIVDVLEDEFPGMLSDEKKFALAARLFAQG